MNTSSTTRTAAGRRFVSRSCIPGLFTATVAIPSVLVIVFVVVAWLTVTRDARLANEPDIAYAAGLWVNGRGHQLDLEARELSIWWDLSWCASSQPGWVSGATASSTMTCGPFDRAVDIYLNDPSKPAFSYDPRAFPSEAVFSQDAVCFQMVHRIGARAKRRYDEQLMIPFDRYSLRAFAAAIDPATNRSVYIARFTIARPLGSFVILSHDADASELALLFENGRATSYPGSRILNAEITRSTITQTFALSLGFINWLLTMGSVYITTLVASGKIEPNNAVAALPFSMMLTIPAVRAIYVDPPSLSTSLDTAGFFVQILTVASCGFILLRMLTLHRSTPSPGGLA